MTKPSRLRLKGREAVAGSSLRFESARSAQKPPSPIGEMAASEPPLSTTSASPYWIVRRARPIAWLPDAHAETTA